MLVRLKSLGLAIVAVAVAAAFVIPAGVASATEPGSGQVVAVPLTENSGAQASNTRGSGGEVGASGALGCAYPYACLYNANQAKVGQFQVVTSGWQAFGRTDVYYAVNTRNDDVVYIRYTNGRVGCLGSGNASLVWNLRALGVPNGIRIDSSSVCFP
ncbi:hypothetical protein [Saccharothrix lopnurensis]|uniref:Peptidase inhibitor family I36 n=1 Tax=Saccharothrix lopnurensis TaxID=1670621 RepID=A0ABW1P3A8_9PSEU